MEDWDSPKRSRLFLAAALLTAACGFMLTNDRLDSPRLVENGLGADVSGAGSASEAATAPPFAVPQPPLGQVAEGAAPAEDLRDAVAALPGMDPAQAAARSAAFAGPAGRVAGAFAPAAAASAWAAHDVLRPSLDGQSAVAISSYSVPSSAKARGSRDIAAVAPGGRQTRGAAGASRGNAAKLSPAERLFAAPEQGLSEVSAGGAAAAGTAAFKREPSTRRRKAPLKGARPAALSRLLGKGALKAPVGVRKPAGDPWTRPLPATGPDGAALKVEPLGQAAAEAVTTPPSCRKPGPHWDAAGDAHWFHDGALRGRLEAGAWAWLQEDRGRWWLWPAPKATPLVDHQDHWWLQSRGLWFLLHDGEPWGYQYLRRWGAEGFVQRSGAQMIYSADGSRLGLVSPGQGAVLYDARTGRELGRWTEDELPGRRAAAGPHAPAF